ncbi:hypothetical protein BFJ70_g14908 [Fusarium oxysporum]|nr:hypothetical protein BFJ70_g14908 [Fusarium oxysporum]
MGRPLGIGVCGASWGGRVVSTFDVSTKAKARYLFLIVNVSKRTLEQTGMIDSWKDDLPAVQELHFPTYHYAGMSTLGPPPNLPSITYAHLKDNVESALNRNDFNDDPLRQKQPSNGNNNVLLSPQLNIGLDLHPCSYARPTVVHFSLRITTPNAICRQSSVHPLWFRQRFEGLACSIHIPSLVDGCLLLIRSTHVTIPTPYSTI